MATLEIQAPDGKTLEIDIPEGTDPSQYDQMVDDVVADYSSQEKPGVIGPAFKSAYEQVKQTPMGLIGEAGLKAISGASDLQQLAAEKGAEALASGTSTMPLGAMVPGGGMQKMPPVAAGLTAGTVVYGPELAAGVLGAPQAARGLVSGAKQLFKRGTSVVEDATAAVPDIETDIARLGLRKSSLQSRLIEQKREAERQLAEIRKGIQDYEKTAEIGLKKTVEVPTNFRKTAETISNTDPKILSKKYTMEELQMLNKQASKARSLVDPTSRVIYDRVKELTTEAQEMLIPGIKGLRQSFGTTSKALEEIPKTFKAEEASLAEQLARKKIALKQAKSMLPPTVNKDSFVKKLVRYGLLGAGGSIGARVGWNLIK